MRRFRVAHASRVLVSASRRNNLFVESRFRAKGANLLIKCANPRRLRQTRETPHTGGQAVRYPNGLADSATTSGNTDWLSRWRKSTMICSTNPASDRGKVNEVFALFPPAGEITRFSNKNRGS